MTGVLHINLKCALTNVTVWGTLTWEAIPPLSYSPIDVVSHMLNDEGVNTEVKE